MDGSRFDRLTKILATPGSRRTAARVLAVLPLVGTGHLLMGDADARRKKQKSEGKAWFCLNGQSIQAPKHKKKKLLKQGATPGQCPPDPCTPDPRDTTCDGKCGSVTNNCRMAVDCGSCAGATPVCSSSNVCVACSSANPCPNGGCCASNGTCIANGMACGDQDVCTFNDTCQNGVCRGTPIDCPQSAPCCPSGTPNSSRCGRHTGQTCGQVYACCSGLCAETLNVCCPSCPNGCTCVPSDTNDVVCINDALIGGGPCTEGQCEAGQACLGGSCWQTCTPLA